MKTNTQWTRGEEKTGGETLYVAYNQVTGRQVVMGLGNKGKLNFKKWVIKHA